MHWSGYLGIAGLLILVYLLVTNASGVAQVVSTLANANTATINALQGRQAFPVAA